jgi:hypothetical protein
MKIQSNHEGAKWINITKALLLFKPSRKVKADWKIRLFKGYGHTNWIIRLPFLYSERTNCGWTFGLMNFYLWWHEARLVEGNYE